MLKSILYSFPPTTDYLMFKALIVSLALLSAPAYADEPADTVQGTITIQSKLMDTGAVVSEDPSIGLDLRFNDVVFPGLFVRSKFDSVSLTPVSDGVEFRTDLSVGYFNTFAKEGTWEVSIARVINPVVVWKDYTELRGRVGYSYFFAEATQGLTADATRDTYVAIGAEANFTPRLSASAKVSGASYNLAHHKVETGCGTIAGCEWTLFSKERVNYFNNFEVSANYKLRGDIDAFVSYSEGGRDYHRDELDNVFWGGINYRF